ncbi:DUF3990 domain-containing protein [Faecalibacterium prausnitzii]|uniref:DUF3990 domain-containing protein n=1 Tax=Faecalibacterium prausnitzii TaxID=853 RepID=UPI001FA95905|nr:DUF3990 domain-containing protein [Faecalibacterium prausnitzii]
MERPFFGSGISRKRQVFLCAIISWRPSSAWPMADDTIWDYVNGFMAGQISREAFWALAKFKHPTHQISFHTVNALRCLTFERSEHIHD